jgi:hypothetical protein
MEADVQRPDALGSQQQQGDGLRQEDAGPAGQEVRKKQGIPACVPESVLILLHV